MARTKTAQENIPTVNNIIPGNNIDIERINDSELKVSSKTRVVFKYKGKTINLYGIINFEDSEEIVFNPQNDQPNERINLNATLNNISWNKISNTPNTLNGYGINTLPFLIHDFYKGIVPANRVLMFYAFTETVKFSINFSESKIRCRTPAANRTSFTILKNSEVIGSIVFEPLQYKANIICDTEIEFTPNNDDYLEIMSPDSQDPTLSDIAINLKGIRVC